MAIKISSSSEFLPNPFQGIISVRLKTDTGHSIEVEPLAGLAEAVSPILIARRSRLYCNVDIQ